MKQKLLTLFTLLLTVCSGARGGVITWNTADNNSTSDDASITKGKNATFTGDDEATVLTYTYSNGCKRLKNNGGLSMNGKSQYDNSNNQRYFTFKAPSSTGKVSITFAAINGKTDGSSSQTADVTIYGGTTVSYTVTTLNSSLDSPTIYGLQAGTSDVIITFSAKCTIKEIKWTDVPVPTYTTVYANDFAASPMGAATIAYSAMSAVASDISNWIGWASSYTGGYYATSSSGKATLSFATPIELASNGTDRGRIRIYWGHTSNGKALSLKVNGSSVAFAPTSIATTLYPKMLNIAEYTIPDATETISSIEAASSNSSGLHLFRIEVLSYAAAPATPTLTGAWKIGDDVVTEANVVQGTSFTLPTFEVAATSGTPGSSDYNVVYSVKAGSTEGILSVTENVPSIDTNTAGEATLVATLTTTNPSKFLTPTTNTFEYTIKTLYSQTNVTGSTEWDWEELTSASVQLTDGTTPKNTDEFVLKNVEIYNDYTIAGFAGDAQQLKVIAQYPFRNDGNGKMLQGDKIQFHTTVPGYVKVTYSNTGGKDEPKDNSDKRPYRYVKVNEMMSVEGSASTTHKTTEAFFVPAGDVAITGYIPNANDPYSRSGDNVGAAMLRIYKVEFTEADAITVTPAGLATYASNYNLDFSEVTGIKAYKASISGKTITFTKMDEVPAGEGMLIRAMSDLDATTTFYVPHKASASPIENAMKRGEGTAVAYQPNPEIDIYNYVLSGGDNGVGFYQANGETVPRDHAYLQSTAALAKGFVINYDDEEGEETDGIKAVSTKVENGVRYNLAGQKVGADYKGIVIVNGKKYLRK